MPGLRFIEVKNKNPLNKRTCILWELFEVSFYARKLKADRVLFPRGYAPMLHLTKTSVIIHDMIPFYYHEQYPGYFNRLENFYIMWRLKASARSADEVIAISEASKRDIMRYSKVSPEKITVIYNGYRGMPTMGIPRYPVRRGRRRTAGISSPIPQRCRTRMRRAS